MNSMSENCESEHAVRIDSWRLPEDVVSTYLTGTRLSSVLTQRFCAGRCPSSATSLPSALQRVCTALDLPRGFVQPLLKLSYLAVELRLTWWRSGGLCKRRVGLGLRELGIRANVISQGHVYLLGGDGNGTPRLALRVLSVLRSREIRRSVLRVGAFGLFALGVRVHTLDSIYSRPAGSFMACRRRSNSREIWVASAVPCKMSCSASGYSKPVVDAPRGHRPPQPRRMSTIRAAMIANATAARTTWIPNTQSN